MTIHTLLTIANVALLMVLIVDYVIKRLTKVRFLTVPDLSRIFWSVLFGGIVGAFGFIAFLALLAMWGILHVNVVTR